MRENRTYGSEGGEDLVLPDPYQFYSSPQEYFVGAASAANAHNQSWCATP